MCGTFFIKTKNGVLIDLINNNFDKIFDKVQKRGPTYTNKLLLDDDTLLIHFLLAINDHIPQPLSHNDIYLLWNGEIYNCPDTYKNDTIYLLEFLIKTINHSDLNIDMINNLDGEFAIILYDKKNNYVHLLTDPFATKPLSYYIDNDTFVACSYDSPILNLISNARPVIAKPNTYYKFDLNSYKLILEKEIYHWDFYPRYDNFNRWNESFIEAVKKRVKTNKGIYLPLSGGYDSGAIMCALLQLNVDFNAYSVLASEDKNILDERTKLLKDKDIKHQYLDIEKDFEKNYNDFIENIEYIEGICPNSNKSYYNIYQAGSCFVLYQIAKVAKNDNKIICLSGQGGDEIYSDYSTQNHSVLKGNYTNVRSKWPNFDAGFGVNVLRMFERSMGSCGIETRYPFLDRNTVQEFLWLSDNLKNKEYKQCLAQLMSTYNFSYLTKKKGLNPNINHISFTKKTMPILRSKKIKFQYPKYQPSKKD